MKPKTPKKVAKPWGYEIWIANNFDNNYCGKILHIEHGHNSSMHFHGEKHETFYILNGGLRVDYIDTETAEESSVVLKEGETLEIDRLQPHKLAPLGGAVDIIEVSTFHKDQDSKRISL